MSRAVFFKQSGWMATAALLGGVFNMASNFLAQRMPEGQFNIFDTALSALGILAIPAVGVQAAFAAQAAAADSDEQRRSLAAAMRGVLAWLGVVWAALAVVCVLWSESLTAAYNLSQPGMLWLLLFICLVTLVTPVPSGVLQGRQDFAWFGAATLMNGLGRFVVLALVVKLLAWGSMGALAGVFAGSMFVLVLVAWRTRDALRADAAAFEWRGWLRRLVPVTFGLGALIFIMQADALIVRDKLQPLLTNDQTDGYSAVRKIAQAMVFMVGALVTVMFPKVARSFQRSEKSDVLKLTVGLTAAVGIAGAAFATVYPDLPLRLLSPGRLIASKSLVPIFCWAFVPLALSNVLVWNLLARECYRSVPWLVAVAAGYWWALNCFHESLLSVIIVLGVAGSVLLAVCGVFVWLEARSHKTPR